MKTKLIKKSVNQNSVSFEKFETNFDVLTNYELMKLMGGDGDEDEDGQIIPPTT